MEIFENPRDKERAHLVELYKKHKALDEKIKELYNGHERDEVLNRLKTQKLWIKDEIHRFETKLGII